MIEMDAAERSRVAEQMGLHEQYLYQCITGRRKLPEAHCPPLERATEGRIKCEDIRPDITWVRVKDKSWPWHAKGKPLVDVLPVES